MSRRGAEPQRVRVLTEYSSLSVPPQLTYVVAGCAVHHKMFLFFTFARPQSKLVPRRSYLTKSLSKHDFMLGLACLAGADYALSGPTLCSRNACNDVSRAGRMYGDLDR